MQEWEKKSAALYACVCVCVKGALKVMLENLCSVALLAISQFLILCVMSAPSAAPSFEIDFDRGTFVLDGKPFR